MVLPKGDGALSSLLHYVHKGPKETTSVPPGLLTEECHFLYTWSSLAFMHFFLLFTTQLLGSTAKGEKMVPDKGQVLEPLIFSVELNLQMKGSREDLHLASEPCSRCLALSKSHNYNTAQRWQRLRVLQNLRALRLQEV